MESPEEIKKALKCRSNLWYYTLHGCTYYRDKISMCSQNVAHDALEYIQHLENHIGELTEKVERLDQVTRERDALLEIVKKLGECNYCKHDSYCLHLIPDCMDCKDENCQCYSCGNRSKWQWRGVQEVEHVR